MSPSPIRSFSKFWATDPRRPEGGLGRWLAAIFLTTGFSALAARDIPATTHIALPCTQSEDWDFGNDIQAAVPATRQREFASLLNRKTSPFSAFAQAQSLHSSANPTAVTFADYWMARAFYSAGLQSPAIARFNAVAQRKPVPVTLPIQIAALQCLERLHRVGVGPVFLPATLDNLAALLARPEIAADAKPVVWEAGVHLVMRLLKENGRAPQIEKALALLDGSGVYQDYARIVWATERDEPATVVDPLKRLADAPELPEALADHQNEMRLVLARVYYDAGQYSLAAHYLDTVDKRSNAVIQAISHQAWVNLVQNNYAKAIGDSIALQSGGLRAAFAPDPLIVASMALNELCLFPESLRMLQTLRKSYQPAFDWLAQHTAKAAHAGKPAAASERLYPLAVSFLKGEPASVPGRIASEWIRSPLFQANQQVINLSFEQEKAIPHWLADAETIQKIQAEELENLRWRYAEAKAKEIAEEKVALTKAAQTAFEVAANAEKLSLDKAQAASAEAGKAQATAKAEASAAADGASKSASADKAAKEGQKAAAEAERHAQAANRASTAAAQAEQQAHQKALAAAQTATEASAVAQKATAAGEKLRAEANDKSRLATEAHTRSEQAAALAEQAKATAHEAKTHALAAARQLAEAKAAVADATAHLDDTLAQSRAGTLRVQQTSDRVAQAKLGLESAKALADSRQQAADKLSDPLADAQRQAQRAADRAKERSQDAREAEQHLQQTEAENPPPTAAPQPTRDGSVKLSPEEEKRIAEAQREAEKAVAEQNERRERKLARARDKARDAVEAEQAAANDLHSAQGAVQLAEKARKEALAAVGEANDRVKAAEKAITDAVQAQEKAAVAQSVADKAVSDARGAVAAAETRAQAAATDATDKTRAAEAAVADAAAREDDSRKARAAAKEAAHEAKLADNQATQAEAATRRAQTAEAKAKQARALADTHAGQAADKARQSAALAAQATQQSTALAAQAKAAVALAATAKETARQLAETAARSAANAKQLGAVAQAAAAAHQHDLALAQAAQKHANDAQSLAERTAKTAAAIAQAAALNPRPASANSPARGLLEAEGKKVPDEFQLDHPSPVLAELTAQLEAAGESQRNLLASLASWREILTRYRDAAAHQREVAMARIETGLRQLNERMIHDLRAVVENADLVEAEIWDGASRDIVWQNAHPEYLQLVKSGKIRSDRRPAGEAKDVYDWGTSKSTLDGKDEIWEDEVGTVMANLEDNCSDKEKYLKLRRSRP